MEKLLQKKGGCKYILEIFAYIWLEIFLLSLGAKIPAFGNTRTVM